MVAVVIAVLYWRERREDQREQAESRHLFSFDAL
jgi:hypothetical protein